MILWIFQKKPSVADPDVHSRTKSYLRKSIASLVRHFLKYHYEIKK